ncbi:hypothetical protein JCM3770_005749 [Rhodotorula araucariae]
MPVPYRPTSTRSPFEGGLKPSRRRFAQPALFALLLLVQTLVIRTFLASPASLSAVVSHLPLHKRVAVPVAAGSPLTPSSTSKAMQHSSLALTPNGRAQLVATGNSVPSSGTLPQRGVDTRAFFPVSRKVRSFAKRQLLGITDKTAVILVSSPVSALHRPQLVPDIAAALQAQGHSRFLVVFITSGTGGSGDDTVSLASLQDAIDARNLARNIRVVAGGVEHPESYLAAADVFLRLSASNETSSLLAEAVAAGLAVVSSATQGMPALVVGDNAGVVVDARLGDADAAAAFAEAVGALLSAATQRTELGTAARTVAEERLDVPVAQVSRFAQLGLVKLAQGKRGAVEAVRSTTQEVPVNRAAHYGALQTVLMEHHDETDSAPLQSRLAQPMVTLPDNA